MPDGREPIADQAIAADEFPFGDEAVVTRDIALGAKS
jgi:hypothetical protein